MKNSSGKSFHSETCSAQTVIVSPIDHAAVIQALGRIKRTPASLLTVEERVVKKVQDKINLMLKNNQQSIDLDLLPRQKKAFKRMLNRLGAYTHTCKIAPKQHCRACTQERYHLDKTKKADSIQP